MKTFYLTCLAFLCLALKTSAQTGACDLYYFTVEFISARPSVSSPGKSDLRVNLSWEQDVNNGNKYTYFHIWEAASYASFNYTNPSPQNAPKAVDLRSTVGTIVIKDPASAHPAFYYGYNPDASYTKVLPAIGSGAILKQEARGKRIVFTVENLLLPGITPDVNNIYSFVGDIWASQQNDGKNVHCFTKGNRFSMDETIDRSTVACGGNGKLQIRIQSTQAAVAGTYQIYVDNVSPGKFDEATDAKLGSDQSFTTSQNATVTGAWSYGFFASDVSIPSQYKGYNLWVVVNAGNKTKQVFPVLNACATLPVTFAGFQASRNKQTVTVRWQTATELNATGFYVQRQTGGDWTEAAYVPAKNSASGASYEVLDANAYAGLSQYRIVEVDADGKQRMSEIRSVRGQNAEGNFTLFPNPSTTGRVSLAFDKNVVRDISVIDMGGRTVKQIRSEGSNNVVFDLPLAGIYQVNITDRTTGETVTGKIIINRR